MLCQIINAALAVLTVQNYREKEGHNYKLYSKLNFHSIKSMV
jgi:hypothetical protein